jgi:hypothetical protein
MCLLTVKPTDLHSYTFFTNSLSNCSANSYTLTVSDLYNHSSGLSHQAGSRGRRQP